MHKRLEPSQNYSKMEEKRYLKYHFPELENPPELPANFRYVQLYIGITIDEEGFGKPLDEVDTIYVKDYQVPAFDLYPVFHKPI